MFSAKTKYGGGCYVANFAKKKKGGDLAPS